MMVQSYPATYRDEAGEEATTIHNDGETLRMVLRGVEFVGHDFCGFRPAQPAGGPDLDPFALFLGQLCTYTLCCQIPVLIAESGGTRQESLGVYIECGSPVAGPPGTLILRRDGTTAGDTRHIDRETLKLTLDLDGESIETSGRNKHHSFDEQLDELRDLLPEGVCLKTCWNCAFSDYHPAGSGSFGGLACFRDNRRAYQRAGSKRDLLRIWDKRTGYVQEIHICPQFEKRPPDGGLYVS